MRGEEVRRLEEEFTIDDLRMTIRNQSQIQGRLISRASLRSCDRCIEGRRGRQPRDRPRRDTDRRVRVRAGADV